MDGKRTPVFGQPLVFAQPLLFPQPLVFPMCAKALVCANALVCPKALVFARRLVFGQPLPHAAQAADAEPKRWLLQAVGTSHEAKLVHALVAAQFLIWQVEAR